MSIFYCKNYFILGSLDGAENAIWKLFKNHPISELKIASASASTQSLRSASTSASNCSKVPLPPLLLPLLHPKRCHAQTTRQILLVFQFPGRAWFLHICILTHLHTHLIMALKQKVDLPSAKCSICTPGMSAGLWSPANMCAPCVWVKKENRNL